METKEKQQKAVALLQRILEGMCVAIAFLTAAVLVVAVVREIINMFTVNDYFADIETYLHSALSIVVGIEFVHMLIDTTPSSILEVLMVALARYIILNHEDPLSNLAGVACIAGLFAIRRFLVRRDERKETPDK